jgi:hypothetical protein
MKHLSEFEKLLKEACAIMVSHDSSLLEKPPSLTLAQVARTSRGIAQNPRGRRAQTTDGELNTARA